MQDQGDPCLSCHHEESRYADPGLRYALQVRLAGIPVHWRTDFAAATIMSEFLGRKRWADWATRTSKKPARNGLDSGLSDGDGQ
jgi:hypothetical protein